MPNLQGVITDPNLSPLWTKVHEILRQCMIPLVISNAVVRCLYRVLLRKIFATKSQSRGNLSKQMYKNFLAPNFIREGRPRLFYRSLLARYSVCLAKFGWVLFADLRVRSLAV